MVQSYCQRVYPRVCGGSMMKAWSQLIASGLSPRVRGKPATPAQGQCHRRSIPACAGEARICACRCAARKVYPRVCGGSYCVQP